MQRNELVAQHTTEQEALIKGVAEEVSKTVGYK
jgi:hypothetical protein